MPSPHGQIQNTLESLHGVVVSENIILIVFMFFSDHRLKTDVRLLWKIGN
jgi:hypothetical protein